MVTGSTKEGPASRGRRRRVIDLLVVMAAAGVLSVALALLLSIGRLLQGEAGEVALNRFRLSVSELAWLGLASVGLAAAVVGIVLQPPEQR